MIVKFSYANACSILKKYYGKEYEEYDVSLELSSTKRIGCSSGWDDCTYTFYQLTGGLKISKIMEQINIREPITFEISLSKEELEKALISSLNEIFMKEEIQVSSITPNKSDITLHFIKTNNKKLLKVRNIEE